MKILLLTSAIYYLFVSPPPPQTPVCHHPTVVPKSINVLQIYNVSTNLTLIAGILISLLIIMCLT
jgi:hypothetical protein